jgi:hypothetical protein
MPAHPVKVAAMATVAAEVVVTAAVMVHAVKAATLPVARAVAPVANAQKVNVPRVNALSVAKAVVAVGEEVAVAASAPVRPNVNALTPKASLLPLTL